MLFYPSEAPAPGALIPGLADTTPLHSASLQFAPVPRYSYTAFSTRAIPVAGHKLEAFPWLPVWEDSAAANAILAEKVKCFLPPGVDDTTELSVNDPRLDWLRDALLDLEAFQAPDVGRESPASFRTACVKEPEDSLQTRAIQVRFATTRSCSDSKSASRPNRVKATAPKCKRRNASPPYRCTSGALADRRMKSSKGRGGI